MSSSSSSSDKEYHSAVGPPPDVNLLLYPEGKKRGEDMWAALQLSLDAAALTSPYPKDKGAAMLAGSENMQGDTGGATTSPRGSISMKNGREPVAGGIHHDPASVKTDKKSSKTADTGLPTISNAAAAASVPPRDQFAQRWEAIDEIVKKLDDLSNAVKQLGVHYQQTRRAHPLRILHANVKAVAPEGEELRAVYHFAKSLVSTTHATPPTNPSYPSSLLSNRALAIRHHHPPNPSIPFSKSCSSPEFVKTTSTL
ncbi:hypothetical protein FRC00_013766 [Tulasnella sp. 408]|nr:hypothetical protein FRC00_013766 [Tulasnella sp. 408]